MVSSLQTDILAYPSLFITFCVTALASGVFMLIAAFKYNSVRVFDHKIRTPNISNSLWISFYLFIFLGSVCNAVRFALLPISLVPSRDSWFEGVSLTLHGLSTLCLCAALNHQRRFRSHGSSVAEELETDPLLRRYDRIKRRVSVADAVFVLLFIAYCVLAWVATMERTVVSRYLFLSLFLLQRLPALFLASLICLKQAPKHADAADATVSDPPQQHVDGPSRGARVLLAFATLFSVSGDVPFSLWALAFGTDCIIWVGSAVDIIHLLYVIGLVLYFAFLRAEYLRNMEECIWHTVQRFQRSFDFRKF